MRTQELNATHLDKITVHKKLIIYVFKDYSCSIKTK